MTADSRAPLLTAAGDHVVCFFQRDDVLISQLSLFVEEGVRLGDRIIVIATPEHLSGLHDALRTKGLTPPPGQRGDLVTLDAATCVDAIVVDGVFVAERLSELLMPLIGRAPRCRVFGEMAALLVERNQLQCALDLELAGSWLSHRLGIRVLCAYNAHRLAAHDHHHGRAAIVSVHDAVLSDAPLPGRA